MAGYKDFVFAKNAAAFWTFDGDVVTNDLKLVGGNIMDEIDNQNPAALSTGNAGAYTFATSLIKNEPSDQRSFLLCPNGKVNGIWTSAYLEVGHTSTFAFPHLGSFTVELVAKKSPESVFVSETNSYPRREYISKAGVFSLYLQYAYSTPTRLYATFPNGASFYIDVDTFHGKSLMDVTTHIVLVWDVRLDDSGTYDYIHTAKYYVNSSLVGYGTYGSVDGVINTNVASPIHIGGTPAGNFQTSKLYIDQIAIYDVALSDSDVSHHYKKIFPYEEMIVNSFPKYYWKMYDAVSDSTMTMKDNFNLLNGSYTSAVVKQQNGPPSIINSNSIQFAGNSMAKVSKEGYYGTLEDIFKATGDYSVEMWIKINSFTRGVIFSVQQDEYPFTGVAIIANKYKSEVRQGSITFSESVGAVVASLPIVNNANVNYSDNAWHHLVAIRRGQYIELWLDGVLHESVQAAPPGTQTNPGQLYLMGMMPFDQFVIGNVSNLAIYPYALSGGQIVSRAFYDKIYNIRGQVTLRGIPVEATIRVYSSKTGNLITEIYSDANTGNYSLDLRTNSRVDILVSIPSDRTVRYRAFGPILPAEFPDITLNL